MSAIDELCQKLADRGEPVVRNSDMVTWLYYSDPHSAVEAMDGTLQVTGLTPEQAVAATLGRDNAGRYVGLRQGEYWERAENSNYYCGGCGWKVTDHDSYCPECGGALHKATLGRGTCHLEEIEKDCDTASEYMLDREWCFDAVYRCSCGCRFGYVAHNRPRFCPNCGAKVVDE